MTVPQRRLARPLVSAAIHEDRARCGACDAFCSGTGDMLCVECLRFLPEWARALYMAAWRSFQAELVGPERIVAARRRCVDAVIEARRAFPLSEPRTQVIVVAHGKTRRAVLAFLSDHPDATLREITQGAGTAYKPTSVLLTLLKNEGKLEATRALGHTKHFRYRLAG